MSTYTALIKAINAAFAANASLAATFPRGLESGGAATGTTPPSCILVEVAGIPDYSTVGSTTPVFIQFTARASSADVCRQALDDLASIFDHQPLAMQQGYLGDARIVGLNRVVKEDQFIYRGDVEYRFTITG